MLATAILPLNLAAVAADPTCGDELTWAISGNTLTISGSGEMYNYEIETAPWYSQHETLTKLVINAGATTIGTYAFYNFGALSSVTIPNTVTTIARSAFSNCPSITNTYYTGASSQWDAIAIGNYNTALTSAPTHYNSEQSTHTWSAWNSGTVTKKATCTSTGIKTYTSTCTCGITKTKTETISKAEHKYKNVVTTKATGDKNGKLTPTCSVCGKKKSSTTIAKYKSLSLSTTKYTYNGKAKKPTVTVKDSKGNKISAKYYTVSYINRATGKTVKSMKNPGKYYVKVKFKTRYSGSLKTGVTIKPKATSVSSLTAKAAGFKVKWSKQSTCTGYQIQYSTSKNFKNAKTTTVSDKTATSKTISGLKSKTKYYVRLRTYKTVKINGKSSKLYSSWSSTKGITTLNRGATVFTGDSVTVGLYGSSYNGISMMNIPGTLKVVAKGGLNTQTLRTSRLFDGKKTALDLVLSYKPYRVYIMLGLNEVSWQKISTSMKHYGELIETIQKKSPGTDIVLLPCPPVTKSVANRKTGFKRIPEYNKNVKAVAKKYGVHYFDFTADITDSSGYLLSKYQGGDGMHWSRATYQVFAKKISAYDKELG